jgi:GTPase SAR1 family protein
MRYAIFIVGTAGSGKSTLTGSFHSWLEMKRQNVIRVNLDPGVVDLPYDPDVDVREIVDIESVMRQYSLGPNGALIMSADLIATNIEKIQSKIDRFGSDYVLVDTPGQMELFAFRASGPFIINEMRCEGKAVLYLFDSAFSINPMNYVSNLFLSLAVQTRFMVPQLQVLSKTDLLSEDDLEKILSWSEDEELLETSMEEEHQETKRLLNRYILDAFKALQLDFSLIPVSSTTSEGFIELFGALQRLLTRGEETL